MSFQRPGSDRVDGAVTELLCFSNLGTRAHPRPYDHFDPVDPIYGHHLDSSVL